MELKTLLNNLGACKSAVDWVGDRSLAQAWAECNRADRMMWLVGTMCGKRGWPPRQKVVLAGCACAEYMLTHVPAGESRAAKAISTARAWVDGRATRREVTIAGDRAERAAFLLSYPASSAAYAAAYAAYAVREPACVAYAAFSPVGLVPRKNLADLVRKQIPSAELPDLDSCDNICRREGGRSWSMKFR